MAGTMTTASGLQCLTTQRSEKSSVGRERGGGKEEDSNDAA